MRDLIPSLITGTNADLMRAVAELYIDAGDLIVDATYGRGGFWRLLPDLEVVAHDLHAGDGVDLRRLPEADSTVDVLVLDPPYRLTETTPNQHRGTEFEDRYGLRNTELENTAAGLTALVELYTSGLREAARVLTKQGRVLIKAQDLVDSHRLVPMGFRVVELAEQTGLPLIDLFVLSTPPGPRGPWSRQLRSRRSHSYLIVAGRSRYWKSANPRRVPLTRPDSLFGELGEVSAPSAQ